LTILFGVISLIAGPTLFGWLGISGSKSLIVRLMVAGVLTSFGVWRTFRRVSPDPTIESLPKTPQGTIILPPERTSRKAVVGACWAPLFLIAGFLYFVPQLTVQNGEVDTGMRWWQILL